MTLINGGSTSKNRNMDCNIGLMMHELKLHTCKYRISMEMLKVENRLMQRIHNISGPSKHPSQAPSRSRNKGPFRIVISEKEADAVPLGGRN